MFGLPFPIPGLGGGGSPGGTTGAQHSTVNVGGNNDWIVNAANATGGNYPRNTDGGFSFGDVRLSSSTVILLAGLAIAAVILLRR